MTNHAAITDFEVLDALCYFCDFIENTSAKDDVPTLIELTQKYIDVLSSKHGESDLMNHTVAYGLGEFGYFIPVAKFKPFITKAVELIKPVVYADDAFEEDNVEGTENSMGALLKLAYKHIDEKNVTK